MASSHHRIRRVAAVHSLIGIVVELGGRIVDGFGHLDPEQIDVLLEELGSRIHGCALQLGSREGDDRDPSGHWLGTAEPLSI